MNRRMMMAIKTGGHAPRLPSEYQEVEYIESTSGSGKRQYIDTGIIIDADCKIICTCDIRLYYGTTALSPYGFNSTSANPRNAVGVYMSGSTPPATIYTSFGTAIDYSFRSSAMSDKAIIEQDKNGVKIDGSTMVSYPSLTFKNNIPSVFLFARAYNNTGAERFIPVKIYSFIIEKDNDELINLVPCYRKVDGIIGMYDMVTKSFFTNDGADVFLKGNDI